MASADFADLLEHELADAKRFRKPEEALARLKREWEREPEKKVVPMKPKRKPKAR